MGLLQTVLGPPYRVSCTSRTVVGYMHAPARGVVPVSGRRLRVPPFSLDGPRRGYEEGGTINRRRPGSPTRNGHVPQETSVVLLQRIRGLTRTPHPNGPRHRSPQAGPIRSGDRVGRSSSGEWEHVRPRPSRSLFASGPTKCSYLGSPSRLSRTLRG